MIKNPTIPVPNNPVLIDAALLEIQTGLMAKLEWVDQAFGKAKTIKETRNGKVLRFPSVYIGGEDYLKVFPDSHLGNFMFFDVDEGEEINQMGRRVQDFDANLGLIVWFDFRSVYPDDWQLKTIENVKSEVIQAVQGLALTLSRTKLLKTWETSEKIYKNYSDLEIENQYLMRPYGGFRIDMKIKFFNNRC